MTDESDKAVEDPAGPGIDRMHADAAIYQAFAPGPVEFTRGPDGLPMPTPTELPVVPPLRPETFVCMADRSRYVVREPNWGEIVCEFQPEEVLRSPSGDYYVPMAAYQKKIWQGPAWVKVSRTCEATPRFLTNEDGHPDVYFSADDPAMHGSGPPSTVSSDDFLAAAYADVRQAVEPIRPQCAHYRRQMTDFQDAAGNQFIERLCTARRDSESFFLSVRDQQVHACELREPRELVSEARLDRFDAAKQKLGAERYEEGGTFDVDAALAKTETEANRGLAFGGIFKE